MMNWKGFGKRPLWCHETLCGICSEGDRRLTKALLSRNDVSDNIRGMHRSDSLERQRIMRKCHNIVLNDVKFS
jgi:hypothetical protein